MSYDDGMSTSSMEFQLSFDISRLPENASA